MTPVPAPEPTNHPRTDIALYRWMTRIGLRSYRLKILLMAFVGTHVPLLALAGWFAARHSQGWSEILATMAVALIATLGGTAVTLLVLDHLLRPVILTSAALRRYRQHRELPALPAVFGDEVGTLMADAGSAIHELDRSLTLLEFVDETTGLPNRRRFLSLVGTRIDRGDYFGVAIVRVTNIERIVDTLGIQLAASAMREIAERLQRHVPMIGSIACVGRGDFACMLSAAGTEAVHWSEAAVHLRRSLTDCGDELQLGDIRVKPALRGGIAIHPDDATSAEALIDRATLAASQGTETAPIILLSATARQQALDRFLLEQELRGAIGAQAFELHYQPVVDLSAERIVGAEALLRWNHPQRGLIMPASFIDVAEASNLIAPIGHWVIRQACRQLRAWNDAGHAGLRMAVNVSARQFHDPRLVDQVLDALRDHGVDPLQLEVELTETAALADFEHTRRVLAQLKDAGVGIAMDDFGTGYASMSYLRKLPIDKLKIDREFVTDVQSTHHSQAICGALMALSRGLDLQVVAEGVERRAEVTYLRDRGCGLFQGYYFGRPMPAHQFSASIAAAAFAALRSPPDEAHADACAA